jgi:hypothetical protein
MPATTEYLSAAETAKLVREALKARFPRQRFSVRASRSCGGVDLRWTDGPTVDQVRPVTDLYEGDWFDGMTDCLHSFSSLLADENGSVREVHFSGFCLEHRDISDDYYEQTLRILEGMLGYTLTRDRSQWYSVTVPIRVDRDGRLLHMVESDREQLGNVLHQYTYANEKC